MKDTICAIATAPGGAIGIVRLSGSDSFPILRRICPRITEATPPRTAVFTSITVPGEPSETSSPSLLDEALVTLFPAPHSYTGEDCAEISCHGSAYILHRVIELLVESGARLAGPGEFTQRAYLNGKLDLSQAEAVADLIAANSAASHRIALSQLRGHFSTQLHQLRDQLLHLTSLLELELDFADHEELEFADRTELLELAKAIDTRVCQLADSFQTGNALKNGIPVAIIGAPNVGKSTLLNALVGEERAIVSDIQGTTRDAIEDTIQLGGITFRFIDTAGIRHTDDVIERLGIQRTYAAIEKATIVLWLIDQQPTASEIADIQARCEGKTLLIVKNKIDKENHWSNHQSSIISHQSSVINHQSSIINHQSSIISHQSSIISHQSSFINHQSSIPLSAKHGIGLDDLRHRLIEAAPKTSDTDVIVTSARHYEALCRAHESLTRVVEGLNDLLPTDLIAEDLRLTLDALADITGGAITPQDTLNNIFAHFCVGK